MNIVDETKEADLGGTSSYCGKDSKAIEYELCTSRKSGGEGM